ncbi:MAG: ATP-binding cassette domain-containing protein [Thermodesulfovibrionales bacterium]|nr:ATP-binding cassette domain-containing protein [Thermodesulfovibrionales bacterium]
MSSKVRTSFIDRGIQSIGELKALLGDAPADSIARHIRAEIKVVLALLFIILTSFMNRIEHLLFLSLVLLSLSIPSRVKSEDFKRLVILTFFFGFLLSLPGALNLLVKGEVAIRLLTLKRSYDIWIYHIPQEIGFTLQGLERTGVLTLRVFNSLASSFILIRTTTFEELMVALRRFRIPWIFLMIVMLSYRYILTFSKVVEDFYLAKKARFAGRLDKTIIQNWIAGRIHFLFKKTMALAEELTFAMKARGSGITGMKIKNHTIHDGPDFNNSDCIRVERVNYSYTRDTTALIDISLAINKGDRYAILGANGSGKSTLLKIMAGLLHPSSGKVFFKGREVTESALRKPDFLREFRSSVGYVFQDPDVQLFSANVYEELMYGPLQLGLNEEEARDRAEEVMEMLKIKGLKDRPPYMLSGGEKKRVAIGSVLTMNPEILLLDEPTSGLDPRTQCFLVELLLLLNEAGKTIVIATHDLALVEELHCKVAVLSEEHRIEKTGTAEDILKDEELLLKVNLVHEHVHRHGSVAHRHIHSHYLFHKH